MRHLIELDSIVGSTTTITAADAAQLKARAQQLGGTAAQFDRWIARFSIVDGTDTNTAPWPVEVRRRVRTLLDTLNDALASEGEWMSWAQTRTLWSFLGVRRTVWLHQLRTRARVLAAEIEETHRDTTTTIRRELLDIVDSWLLLDSGPAAYEVSVTLDVQDALARTARGQIRVNDQLQSPQILELIEAAAGAGADLAWNSLEQLVKAHVMAGAAEVDQPGNEFGIDPFITAATIMGAAARVDQRFSAAKTDAQATIHPKIEAGTAWIEQWHYERLQSSLKPAVTWDAAARDSARSEASIADNLVVRTSAGRVVLFTELGELHEYRSTFVDDGERRGLTRRRTLARRTVKNKTVGLWRVYEGRAGTFVPVMQTGWTGSQFTGFARAWNEATSGRRETDGKPATTRSSFGLMSVEQATAFLRECCEGGLEWVGRSSETYLPDLDRCYRPRHSHATTREENACIDAYAALGTYESHKTTGGMGISETQMVRISRLTTKIDDAIYDGFCFEIRQHDETNSSAVSGRTTSLLPARTVVVRSLLDRSATWPVFKPGHATVPPKQGARLNLLSGAIVPEFFGGQDAQPGKYYIEGRPEPEKFLVVMYNGADEVPDGGTDPGGSLRDCAIVLRTEIAMFLVALTRPTSNWPEQPILSGFRFEDPDGLD